MMNIIVTGSTGLVGSSCVREAMEEHNVHIYTISRKGKACNKFNNSSHFNSLSELPRSINYDLLIHAAAATPNNTELKKISEQNRIIDKNMCSFLEKASVKHVCYLSTMAIYGNIYESKITEETVPNSPNAYGLSKISGEKMVAETVSYSKTKLSVLRLPGVVGRGMPHIFFRRCYDWLINSKPIKVQSLDAPFNNAIYVSDIFKTALKINSCITKKETTLNLHSHDTLRLEQFLSIYAEKLQVDPNIIVDDTAGKPFLITNKENGDLVTTRSISSIIDSYLCS